MITALYWPWCSTYLNCCTSLFIFQVICTSLTGGADKSVNKTMLRVECNSANVMPCQICDLCTVYEEIGFGEIIKVYELPQHRWRPQGQCRGSTVWAEVLHCVCVWDLTSHKMLALILYALIVKMFSSTLLLRLVDLSVKKNKTKKKTCTLELILTSTDCVTCDSNHMF